MIVPPQILLLQTVLQNQQFQTQQYGSTRITKPHESDVEIPTNLMATTCCDALPSKETTYYCYMPPIHTICNIYRSY